MILGHGNRHQSSYKREKCIAKESVSSWSLKCQHSKTQRRTKLVVIVVVVVLVLFNLIYFPENVTVIIFMFNLIDMVYYWWYSID